MARHLWRPSRAVVALRQGAVRLLRRAADSLEPPRPAEPVRAPGGPPEHWLRLVAEHAPGLLRDLGPGVADTREAETREAGAPPRQPPIEARPARVSSSFLGGVRAALRARQQRDPGPAPVVQPVSPRAVPAVPAAVRPSPEPEPETPVIRPALSDVDRWADTDRARLSTAPAASRSRPASTTRTPAEPPFGPARSVAEPPFGPAHRSGAEPETVAPAVRRRADPWPGLPGAVISRAEPADLPAAIRYPQISLPAMPSRFPPGEQPRTVRRAAAPQAAPIAELPVTPSLWPELPSQDEIWEAQRSLSDPDRIARLAREQAGG